MSMPRVLIVEDEPMVAMDLESIVLAAIAAEVVVVASVSGAFQAMAAPLDFAILDIEVTDGKTFEIALELRRREARFVFVSGAQPEALPPDLRGAPFISKPFNRRQIERFCVNNRGRGLSDRVESRRACDPAPQSRDRRGAGDSWLLSRGLGWKEPLSQ
jgi:DNA-binding LytR/AlgR family response regulator